VSVKSAGPFKVAASNAAQLATPAVNTQAIAVVRKAGNGKYKVLVVIHRWPPARRLDGQSMNALSLDLGLFPVGSEPAPEEVSETDEECEYLHSFGMWGDKWEYEDQQVKNLVPGQDSPSEDQVDVAVRAKCPGAEAPEGDDS
jgi:hypothetical protein